MVSSLFYLEIAINGSVPSMLSSVMVYSLTIGPSRTPCFESCFTTFIPIIHPIILPTEAYQDSTTTVDHTGVPGRVLHRCKFFHQQHHQLKVFLHVATAVSELARPWAYHLETALEHHLVFGNGWSSLKKTTYVSSLVN